MGPIRRVHRPISRVYGAREVWRQLRRKASRGGPLHGGAPDATEWGSTRRRQRQGEQDHDSADKASLAGGQKVNRQFRRRQAMPPASERQGARRCALDSAIGR